MNEESPEQYSWKSSLHSGPAFTLYLRLQLLYGGSSTEKQNTGRSLILTDPRFPVFSFGNCHPTEVVDCKYQFSRGGRSATISIGSYVNC